MSEDDIVRHSVNGRISSRIDHIGGGGNVGTGWNKRSFAEGIDGRFNAINGCVSSLLGSFILVLVHHLCITPIRYSYY